MKMDVKSELTIAWGVRAKLMAEGCELSNGMVFGP